jgi:uncharacterized protein YjbJ (UPF0337 family)
LHAPLQRTKNYKMTTDNVTTAPTAFKVKGNWSILTTKLKSQYPTLTDDDLKFETGKEAELLKNVGNRLGKTLEETTAILEKEMNQS